MDRRFHGWRKHPGVRSGEQLTRGERAADTMRNSMGSWGFVFGALLFLAVWMTANGGLTHFDKYPYILLNLVLSCVAALQGAILLIAAKRSDQVSSELAQHDYQTDQEAKELLDTLKTDFAAMMQTQAAQDIQLKQQTAALMAILAKYGPPYPPEAPVPAPVSPGGGPGPVAAAAAVPQGDGQ